MSKNKNAYCIECGQVTSNPIYGEYPEEGELLCSKECLKAYDARGAEADAHAQRWRANNP